MTKFQPVPIVGGAYQDDTLPWTAQDCVNYLPVAAEKPGGRSESLLRGAPGLVRFAQADTRVCRGLHNVEGQLYGIFGTVLYRIENDYTLTSVGTIPGIRRCGMAHNQITGGNELLVVNGTDGYVYNTKTATFAKISDTGYPGAKACDYVDSYLVQVEPQGRYWFNSELADATSYLTTSTYESEVAPDRIVSLIVSNRQVVVLSERSIEFFINAPVSGNTSPFQRQQGTSLEIGCGAVASVARMDNAVVFLGNDGIVYELRGYNVRRISTTAIEQAISRSTLDTAFAMVWEDRGHKVYYLTLLDGQTFGWDILSGEWHRRESHRLNRWRVNALCRWGDKWVAGDYSTGDLYFFDWDEPTEAQRPLIGERVTGVYASDQNRVQAHAFEIVMDTGAAAKRAPFVPFTIRGTPTDGIVGAAYSYYMTPFGARGDVTWSWSGSTPDGLDINSSTGEIYGVPTSAALFSGITVTGVDSAGRTATHTISIYIVNTILGWFAYQTSALDATGETLRIGYARMFGGYSWETIASYDISEAISRRTNSSLVMQNCLISLVGQSESSGTDRAGLYAFGYDGSSSLAKITSWRFPAIAGNNDQYFSVAAFDGSTLIVTANNIGTTRTWLFALGFDGAAFTLLGSLDLGDGDVRVCCVHAGVVMLLRRGTANLKAYDWDGAAFNLLDTYSTIYDHGGSSTQPTIIESDGTYTYLNNGQVFSYGSSTITQEGALLTSLVPYGGLAHLYNGERNIVYQNFAGTSIKAYTFVAPTFTLETTISNTGYDRGTANFDSSLAFANWDYTLLLAPQVSGVGSTSSAVIRFDDGPIYTSVASFDFPTASTNSELVHLSVIEELTL